MQTAAVEREVVSSGSMTKAAFGISQAHAAHIMGILRSTLYTRKALAVLREYSANAWDEHRQAGMGDKPIKVSLPTVFRPTLKIRDFGRGLSEHDVLHIYTQYGESTKRGTNDASGMLGIGCKSGFAYSDSFTVTSWHAGMKSIYIAVLDKSNQGEMQKVMEEPCGDETGIEIQIAVKPRDVEEFQKEARALFRYFNPRPDINLELPDLPKGMPSGFVNDAQDGDKSWVAVMGCIPYKLDIEQLKEPLTEAGLWEGLGRLGGGAYLPMGSVEFSASREELQYTEVTIKALVAHLKQLMDDYVNDALQVITREDVGGWHRRAKATFLHRTLKFTLPKEYQPWLDEHVALVNKTKGAAYKTFHLVTDDKCRTTAIAVRTNVAILIKDDPRDLKGWHFQHGSDVLAVPSEGCTYDQVKAEIEQLLIDSDLVGLPIAKLTSRAYWSAYSRNGRRRTQDPVNPKHLARTFILKTMFHDRDRNSDNWELLPKPPTDDHLYLVLEEFSPKGFTLNQLEQDFQVFLHYKVPVPVIYGYKHTLNRPFKAEFVTNGTPYMTWRAKAMLDLITDEIKDQLREKAWSEVFSGVSYREGREFPSELPGLVKSLEQDLGPKHKVTRYFGRYLEAHGKVKSVPYSEYSFTAALAKAAGYSSKRDGPAEWLNRIHRAYPMTQVCIPDASQMFLFRKTHHYQRLVEYIQQQDKLAGGSNEQPQA